MSLSFSDILSASKPKVHPVKAFGGEVFVRVMSGTERDEYDQFQRSRTDDKGRLKDQRGIRQKLLTLALSDKNGDKLIQSEADGKKLFDAADSVELCKVFDAAQKLNGLTDESLEDTAKNSSGTGAATSG